MSSRPDARKTQPGEIRMITTPHLACVIFGTAGYVYGRCGTMAKPFGPIDREKTFWDIPPPWRHEFDDILDRITFDLIIAMKELS